MGELDRFWRGVAMVARLVFRVLLGWRIDIDGLERVPRDGGAVLAFNHHSYVDVVMLAWGPVIQLGRPIRFLAKKELFEHPATRWLATRAGAVPVDRSAGGRSTRLAAYDAAVQALRDGELVAVAPEQTISDSFELLPFRTGAARMAAAAGVPIVPVVGWGSQRAFPHDRRPRPHRRLPVVVRYGDPIHPAADEQARLTTQRLRRRMAVMLDEVQRSYVDRPAPGDDWWQPARLGGSAPAHGHAIEHLEQRFGDAQRDRRDHRDGGSAAGRAS